MPGDLERRVDHKRKDGKEDEGAHKANLLADDSEDVVVMRLGQIVVLHGGVANTATKEAARRKRHNGKRCLVPVAILIFPGVAQQQALHAVGRGENENQRHQAAH